MPCNSLGSPHPETVPRRIPVNNQDGSRLAQVAPQPVGCDQSTPTLEITSTAIRYEIKHRPSAQQKAADAISRLATEGLDRKEIDDELPVLMVDNDEQTRRPVRLDPETTWEVTQVFPTDGNDDQTEVQHISQDETIAEQEEDVVCDRYR